LILPSLLSNRIFIVDTKNERAPEMFKTLESTDFFDQGQPRGYAGADHYYHTPHTTHCLPDGRVMISTMGKQIGGGIGGAGQFILLNSSFDVIGESKHLTSMLLVRLWSHGVWEPC
jgi:methanethiol oxidase